jgi:DNA-binding NarL/FixJ family response regulator
VRVLLCEDHEVYRAGLRVLLEAEGDLTVVCEVGDLPTAATLAGPTGARVVVVRQGLATADPAQLRALRAQEVAVLLLTEPEGGLPELVSALRAGARGCVSRRAGAQQLVASVRALARDGAALDSDLTDHLVRRLTGGGRPVSPPGSRPVVRAGGHGVLGGLTERQREVAALVADGLSNDEVARRLFLSTTTVKSHLTTVLRLLGLRTRLQLAVLVAREAAAQDGPARGTSAVE